MTTKTEYPEARQRILEVATEEFANKGFDGARIEIIMKKSEVSKNLIYHYFDSKENLFRTVLESNYKRVRFDHDNWPDPDRSPTENLLTLVHLIFDHWRTSSRFIKLLTSENFSQGAHIRQMDTIRDGYRERIRKIEDLLAEGVRRGEFQPDVDATELYVSISSLVYHRISNRYTLAYLLDRDYGDTALFEACKNDISHMIMSYVRTARTDRPAREP